MDETQWLPAEARQRIDAGVSALRVVFGDGLRAALLVGAAATPSREDRAREPEVLALVDQASVADLERLASTAQSVMRQGLRIRVLTQRDLERSTDVFALEVAEWRDRHVLLVGSDPFRACHIEPEDLRRSLEAALRGLGRRLRNRVLAGWATGGRRDDSNRAIVDGVNRLIAIAHHALGLVGDEPPSEERALLEALARRADTDPTALLDELGLVRKQGAPGDAKRALSALLELVEGATRWIDGARVA